MERNEDRGRRKSRLDDPSPHLIVTLANAGGIGALKLRGCLAFRVWSVFSLVHARLSRSGSWETKDPFRGYRLKIGLTAAKNVTIWFRGIPYCCDNLIPRFGAQAFGRVEAAGSHLAGGSEEIAGRFGVGGPFSPVRIQSGSGPVQLSRGSFIDFLEYSS